MKENTTTQKDTPVMLSIKETADRFKLPVHFIRSLVADRKVYAVQAGSRMIRCVCRWQARHRVTRSVHTSSFPTLQYFKWCTCSGLADVPMHPHPWHRNPSIFMRAIFSCCQCSPCKYCRYSVFVKRSVMRSPRFSPHQKWT